ncbi:MAG TPA: TIGR04255 family protein [Solirubrobacteraceae bacterium]|jgi:uncharacterized protein (TIGR04255 family)
MSNEIYPHAPVSFVGFTLVFPLSPKLERKETKDAVYERLQATFPLLEHLGGVRIQIPIAGPALGQPPAQAGMPEKARMMNRERTRSITLGPRMIAVENTEHESFEHLRELLEEVLGALVEVAAPTGMSAVKLKYVDEIRHPSAQSTADWRGLLHDSLLGPTSLLKVEPQQTAGVAVYEVEPHHELRVGYGAAADGFVVDPNGPLRVQAHEPGPFFRLDIEAEWSAPEEALPPLTVPEVLTITDALHDSIRGAFESAITDKLRDHFRGDNGGA